MENEKEFNYGDGIKSEVKRLMKENNYSLTDDQISDIVFAVCNDDEINNLLDERILDAMKDELKNNQEG